MQEVLQQALTRAIRAAEREFLGPQREFLRGLEADRLRKSTLRLRACVTPPSPTVLERVAVRLGQLLSADLGVPIEVRIVADLGHPDPSKIEPLIDEGNRTAHLMFDALAEGRSEGLNPAFVYGPSGVGKTHLLRGFLARVQLPVSAWLGAEFHQTVARHLRGPGLMRWRASLLKSRIFVIDEVHRVGGKRRTQSELASLIDQLVARSTQIVFLGRHHPRKIHNLRQALASRFLGGFTVELGPPHRMTRLRFLRKLGVDVSQHGELVRAVLAGAQTYGDIVRHVRRVRAGKGESLDDKEQFVAALMERVASAFGVSVADLRHHESSRRVSLPRQVVVFVARRAGIPGAEMARRFGWKSASTATYAVHRVEQQMSRDPELRRTVQDLL